MTEKDTLSTNHKKALAALLTNKTVRAAAAACNLAERTLWRYLENTNFRQALRQAQEVLYKEIINRLTVGANQALDELETLITSAESEAVKRHAISDWMGYTLKLYELQELEARISALEEKM